MTEAKVTVFEPGRDEKVVVVDGEYGLKLVTGVKGFGAIGVTHLEGESGLNQVRVATNVGTRRQEIRVFDHPTCGEVNIGEGVRVRVEHL